MTNTTDNVMYPGKKAVSFILMALALHCSVSVIAQFNHNTRSGRQKKVFAHYMIAHLPEGRRNTTIDDLKMEIRYAQEHGIDGFALNCGGWLGREPFYRQRTVEMYEAAKQLNTGFLLFISADFCCSITLDNFADMVTTFRNHPNQYRIGSRPFISTFAGGKKGLTAFVEKTFTGDSSIYFIPFYYPDPATELPTAEEIRKTLASHPSLDGFFYFGAAGKPEAIADVTRRMSRIWHAAGKTFMAPVTPYYQGVKQPPKHRLFESRGFEGMAKQWMAAIEADAEWVEIVTWNDYMENSYLSPIKTNTAYYRSYGNDTKWILPHAAFLKASRYFMEWFKSGKAPVIKTDELYYFYRIHPKHIKSAFGEFVGRHEVKDSVFITIYAKSAAELTVRIGSQHATYPLKKGVNFLASPMSEGKPQFTIKRKGKVTIDKLGEYAISGNNNWAEFNYHSGTGERQD